jgi:hypothetical protein
MAPLPAAPHVAPDDTGKKLEIPIDMTCADSLLGQPASVRHSGTDRLSVSRSMRRPPPAQLSIKRSRVSKRDNSVSHNR